MCWIARAAKPLGAEVCVASCYNALKAIKYADASGGDLTACKNDFRINSTFACIRLHCSEHDIEPGIRWWSETCKKSKAVVNIDAFQDFVAGIDLENVTALPVVDLKESQVFNRTVTPSEQAWNVAYATVVGRVPCSVQISD